MSRRLHPTTTDYVVIAINPALIMLLIGSLVYFLLELFYQGQYPARLHYCLFWYILGMVLVSRISMEEGWDHAAPFGAALVIVVALAMNRFVVYKDQSLVAFGWLINYSLMALIWWCAHQLTWDCTLVDDSQDASGEGLLQTTGLNERAENGDSADSTLTPALSQSERERPKRRGSAPELPPESNELLGAAATGSKEEKKSWWDKFVERRRRPHAPGVWVVYFSLVALPLFGIGQAFIPASNTASRRNAFLLLCVYVASALGLLLTTSFLGLRRYLRQRRLEMPAAMAGAWLTMGGILIVGLIFATALLPRPSAEYAISQLPGAAGSEDQQSSDISAGKEGTNDAQAKSGSGTDDKSNEASSKSNGDQSGKSAGAGESTGGDKSASDGKSASDAKSASDSKQSDGGSQSGKKGNENSSSGKSDDDKSGTGKSESSNSSQKSNGANGKEANSQQSNPQQPKSNQTPSDQKQSQPNDGQQQAQPENQTETSSTPSEPSFDADWLLDIAKWIFYGGLVLAALWWAWRHWDELIAWLRNLFGGLGGLFSRKQKSEAMAPMPIRHKAFFEFSDPFVSGLANQVPSAELVRYTFEALEAWARDNGLPREEDQTAYEFARQVGAHAEHLAGGARQLADLYSRAAYAPGTLPKSSAEQLREFWRALASQPASV